MGILSAIDKSLSFFMLNTRGDMRVHRARELYQTNRLYEEDRLQSELEKAIHLMSFYDFQIQRKFGLGFLLSFFPFTDAYKARVNYFKAAIAFDEMIKECTEYKGNDNSLKLFLSNLYLKSPISLLFYFQKFISNYYAVFGTAKNNIRSNRKDSLINLLAYLPIISSFTKKSKTQIFLDLMHTLFNPAKLLSQLLRFSHRSIDRILEVGTEEPNLYGRSISAWPRVIFKSLSALVFLPARFIMATAEAAIDSIGVTVKFMAFGPLKFLYESAKQTIKYLGKDFIITDINTLRGIKAVRRVAKALNQLPLNELNSPFLDKIPDGKKSIYQQSFKEIFSHMSKSEIHQSEYLIFSKKTVYRDDPAPSNLPLILVTSSSEKTKQIEEYGNFFKKNKERFKNDQPLNKKSETEESSLVMDILESIVSI